jgi:hypothetical protein
VDKVVDNFYQIYSPNSSDFYHVDVMSFI